MSCFSLKIAHRGYFFYEKPADLAPQGPQGVFFSSEGGPAAGPEGAVRKGRAARRAPAALGRQVPACLAWAPAGGPKGRKADGRPEGPEQKRKKSWQKKEKRKSAAPPRECSMLGAYGTSQSNSAIPRRECRTALRALCTLTNLRFVRVNSARTPPPAVLMVRSLSYGQLAHLHTTLHGCV